MRNAASFSDSSFEVSRAGTALAVVDGRDDDPEARLLIDETVPDPESAAGGYWIWSRYSEIPRPVRPKQRYSVIPSPMCVTMPARRLRSGM